MTIRVETPDGEIPVHARPDTRKPRRPARPRKMSDRQYARLLKRIGVSK